MKSSALQLAKQIVNDNKSFIDGNIAEYMIQEVDSNDNNFYQYLTDEEIEEMNGNVQKTQELGEEVYTMLKENFNYDISEFVY
jgi:ribosomal protein S13